MREREIHLNGTSGVIICSARICVIRALFLMRTRAAEAHQQKSYGSARFNRYFFLTSC